MAVSRLSRRAMLRGMLGGSVVAIGLPAFDLFLNGNGNAYADGGSGFPTRFGIFFWGNGMLPQHWTPKGAGADWQLSESLKPLAALQKSITVVTGTRLEIPNNVPHFATAAGILSGRPLTKVGEDMTFSGQSIDQIIADVLGADTRFRSLEFGAGSKDGLSYNGPNSRNSAENSPHALFERLFGAGFTLPGDKPVVDPTLALRQSVLDAVVDDGKRLRAALGVNDQKRLDQHMDGIRALEKRLAKLQLSPPALAACKVPKEPLADYPDVLGRPQLLEKNAIFAELSAMALACDQTRVFSNWFTHPVNNLLFQGAPAGHHQLTHDEPADQPEVHKIVLQCVTAMAAQIAALQNVKEGDGTLLDHCAVLCCSEVSLGKTHSLEDMPIVIAGGAGGKLKTGLHYHSPASENASKVLLSLCRACGLTLPSFGADGGHVTEGLSAIEA